MMSRYRWDLSANLAHDNHKLANMSSSTLAFHFHVFMWSSTKNLNHYITLPFLVSVRQLGLHYRLTCRDKHYLTMSTSFSSSMADVNRQQNKYPERVWCWTTSTFSGEPRGLETLPDLLLYNSHDKSSQLEPNWQSSEKSDKSQWVLGNNTQAGDGINTNI